MNGRDMYEFELSDLKKHKMRSIVQQEVNEENRITFQE
jgi:hypothetical protein